MTAWLWPDRVIYKRESRRLREGHNAVVNSHDELLTVCKAALSQHDDNELCPAFGLGPTVAADMRAAIAKGKAVA